MNTLLTLSCLLLTSPPVAETEPENPDADPAAEQTEKSSSDAPPEAETAPAPAEADEADEPAATDEPSTAETPASEVADAEPAAPDAEETAPDPKQGGDMAPVQPFTAPASAKKPRPARPLLWRLDFSLGVASTLVGDTGYLAFSDDKPLLGADFGVRFDYRLGQRFFVGGGARYSRFATERDPYDGLLSTELTVHEPTVYGRASLMTVEGVDVFADLGGGPSIVLDRISSAQTSAKRRRTATGAFSATGGVSLYLPKQWLPGKQASRVTAGLETRLGYQFRGAIDMSTDPSLDDEPLRTTTADYGDLGLRGFVWGVSLFIRVM